MQAHPLVRQTSRWTWALAVSVLMLAPPAPAADANAQKGPPNRLAKESSPYLLQHAHNPVNWYPWGAEAFEKARKEKKLVFLSIGYSSCHWCHVMERESFSNTDVAKVLNKHFVCIKVDREERPDVDEIYMTALTVSGESGGWPLSMFLTPDGKPIFGGTYIPPTDKDVPGGKILGFDSVLKTVLDLHRTKEKEIFAQADRLADLTKEELERHGRLLVLTPLDRSLVDAAATAHDIDPEWGGLGSKSRGFDHTKFPRAAVWRFLLSQSQKPGQDALAKDVAHTLRQMAQGGIYDHLGGGFHRYSTERTWTVPHFEKMLYDNAQLVELYAEAFRHTPDPLYRRVVRETLDFVKRDMTSPEGGFYSALDADTNENEGEFYVWTLEEIKTLLGNPADFDLFRKVYAASEPNFEGKFYVLRLPKPLTEIAAGLKLTEPELLAKLEPLKAKLLAARAKRERPFRDTKIVTGWNGQMIAAYARAGQVFREAAWTDAATRAAEFVLKNLRNGEGRLLRTYAARPGEKPVARGPAFLDDYAFLVHGLLCLHDATGEKRWLDEATALTDAMTRWHGDTDRGGFYFTAHDHEKLFARAKDSYDGAQPSGNGLAALNLLALARKTGEAKYREAAHKLLKQFAGVLKLNPGSAPMMALALDEYLGANAAPAVPFNPLASPKSAAKAKASQDVVAGELTLAPAADGQQTFTLTLTVETPYHIYANRVGVKDLEEAATRVEVLRDGKPVAADVTYPSGQAANDDKLGKYFIHEGRVSLAGVVKNGPGVLEVRVHVMACRDGVCLLPSVLIFKAK